MSDGFTSSLESDETAITTMRARSTPMRWSIGSRTASP